MEITNEHIKSNKFSGFIVNKLLKSASINIGTDSMVTLEMDLLPKEAQFYCACGPKPMLKGLHSKWGTNGFVSLEERMSCGFGACYGCVIPTTSGYQRVCKEGPVFEAGELLWQEL